MGKDALIHVSRWRNSGRLSQAFLSQYSFNSDSTPRGGGRFTWHKVPHRTSGLYPASDTYRSDDPSGGSASRILHRRFWHVLATGRRGTGSHRLWYGGARLSDLHRPICPTQGRPSHVLSSDTILPPPLAFLLELRQLACGVLCHQRACLCLVLVDAPVRVATAILGIGTKNV